MSTTAGHKVNSLPLLSTFQSVDSPFTSLKHFIFPRSYLPQVLLHHIQTLLIFPRSYLPQVLLHHIHTYLLFGLPHITCLDCPSLSLPGKTMGILIASLFAITADSSCQPHNKICLLSLIIPLIFTGAPVTHNNPVIFSTDSMEPVLYSFFTSQSQFPFP